MVRAGLTQLLRRPPITGRLAILCGLVAVGLPTFIRAMASGVVTGCEFTPYLPFVLLSAILLRWWMAGTVALASVAVLGGLFGGAPSHDANCFLSAAGIFLAASAVMILVAVSFRLAIASIENRMKDEPTGGIIFSLDKGQVWASWYGNRSPVNLGGHRRVSDMMKDFLAQSELGKRLSRKSQDNQRN